MQSSTQLTIVPNYQGASAGGQAYGIQPTASFARDLALGVSQLLNTFGAVRDGIGQGLIPDGTVSTPAIRFASDQDSGIARLAENAVGLIVGGIARASLNSSGLAVAGDVRVRDKVLLQRGSGALDLPVMTYWSGVGGPLTSGNKGDTLAIGSAGGDGLVFVNGDVERARLDASGNLLVGVSSGICHRISKSVGLGNPIMQIRDEAQGVAALAIQSVNQGNYSSMGAGLFAGVNTSTGRTMNAGGTINASGADYAEYMLKAAGCGVIAKGDVCGVDRDGKLTKTWADAISFVIKSTDPSYVGGDNWAGHPAPKPEQPAAEPQVPIYPAAPANEMDEASMAAWIEAKAAHPQLLASYQVQHAAWQQADAAYAAELAAWEDELETARRCVDRIAFCGQVPCNVTGDFEVGDYIIAAANGAGIKAIAVKPDAMTLPQYMRRIGKVWAIRDGRAWIDVQHG